VLDVLVLVDVVVASVVLVVGATGVVVVVASVVVVLVVVVTRVLVVLPAATHWQPMHCMPASAHGVVGSQSSAASTNSSPQLDAEAVNGARGVCRPRSTPLAVVQSSA
jgi:hypothetical protein